MNAFCEMCGKPRERNKEPCPFCGHIPIDPQPGIDQQKTVYTAEPHPPAQPQFVSEQQAPFQPKQGIPMNNPVPNFVPPVQMPYQSLEPTPQKAKKQKKEKKKHKLPRIVRFLITVIIIAGVLLGLWYAFGNVITLYIHSEDVLETLNSGSLELSGTESAYDELPDYIKDMLGEDYVEEDYGPVTKAVLPYISVERVSVNGFFNGSTVTYEISAPDLESWLLSFDATSVADENQLLEQMKIYMENAPLRTAEVEISYARSGFFSVDWRGNYYTREFSDAICGGFNSAYNVLYQQAMDEFEQAIKAAEEAAE